MLLILMVNLSWLIFDSLFANQFIQSGLEVISSDFFIFYRDRVHPNFPTYDQFFIGIYVTELIIRWGIAIKRKTYYRWFFYPIAHWYDVLGCIPVGSFVWLRLLRVISILYRLRKYNLIDFSNTALAATIRKYMDILVEEVSDQVVVNVLNGVQDEVRNRHEIVAKIAKDAFEPNRDDLFQWLSKKITEVIAISYEPNRETIKTYLQVTIDKAADQNQAVSALQKLPVVGDLVVDAVEHLVADLIFQITDQIIADVSAADKYQTIEEITDLLSHAIAEEDSEINRILMAILDQSIDIIKEQVKTKEWAYKYGVKEFQ